MGARKAFATRSLPQEEVVAERGLRSTEDAASHLNMLEVLEQDPEVYKGEKEKLEQPRHGRDREVQ